MNPAQRSETQRRLRSVAANAQALADLLEPQAGRPFDSERFAKCRAALAADVEAITNDIEAV